jgi:hypothetical protein
MAGAAPAGEAKPPADSEEVSGFYSPFGMAGTASAGATVTARSPVDDDNATGFYSPFGMLGAAPAPTPALSASVVINDSYVEVHPTPDTLAAPHDAAAAAHDNYVEVHSPQLPNGAAAGASVQDATQPDISVDITSTSEPVSSTLVKDAGPTVKSAERLESFV